MINYIKAPINKNNLLLDGIFGVEHQYLNEHQPVPAHEHLILQ